MEIGRRGGRATYAVADVANPNAVDGIADVALREFGAIDTWVNNAGVSIFGKLREVPLEDKRRMFDTNFWASSTAAGPPYAIWNASAAPS